MRAVCLLPSLLLSISLYGCTKADDTSVDTDDFVVDTDSCDGDGDGVCPADGDCDDANPDIYPGRTEDCNGIDDNCNGVVDEGTTDVDGDGVCDGQDAEDCDAEDNDGDGLIDEDYADSDGDGHADCIDGEDCDGVDNNGDGRIDEGYDADGDGVTQCAGDCDDGDATISTSTAENDSDGKDNDCDGYVDEGAWSAGDLFITEIMNNPVAVSDPKGEWIEVYNASSRTLVLNGLAISDAAGSDWHQITSDDKLTLAPGEYFVLAAEMNPAVNGGVTADYEFSGVTLGNGADNIQLSVVDDDGVTVVIDSVSWDGGVLFPNPTKGSMTLEPTFLAAAYNDDGTYWCEAPSSWAAGGDHGSPGVENDWCTSFDHDSDGYSQDDGDCADDDEAVYPGAPETDPSVDNDCDGAIEHGPTADARLGSTTTEECSTITLDGSNSSDPNGDTALTYAWELTSAPATSARTSADITNASSSSASFVPDVDGDYVFTLTVWDSGGAASTPDTVSVTVTDRASNSTPTANAGTNQTASATATCTAMSYGSTGYECESCDDYNFTLDGTGSSDSDGDDLTYAWTVTTGAGSLSDSTSATPTLTVSSPATDYGITESETVFVSLRVTDCMGAVSSADTVAVAYSCTGS